MRIKDIEKKINILSNLLITILAISTLFEDLGINIVELIKLTPEMIRVVLERYFPFFWGCHLTLLFVVIIEGYVGTYVQEKYPDAYKTKYLPTVSMLIFVLAFISFIAFRRFLDLFLMICSFACIISR